VQATALEASECKTAQDVIITRADADAPMGILPVDMHSSGGRRRNKYYLDTGVWYFPQVCYTAGGGIFRSISPFSFLQLF
jgi:hypothetical protein